MAPRFTATVESLATHEVPAWFHDAKFGIFVTWTMSSIPAFAPQAGSLPDLLRSHPADIQKYSPYAEWYANTMKIADSDTARYHAETYGAQTPYASFREPFERTLASWDPDPLVDLAVAAGARYLVLVTKHHDGFALWPTGVPNPRNPGWCSSRDVVGDLARAARANGLRFGVYYSGGLDWTFNPAPILNALEMLTSVPTTAEYRRYVDAHYRELMVHYSPDLLWNDIAYPPGPELHVMLADYYNTHPEGVINDRWGQPGTRIFPFAEHYDFRTPEYTQFREIHSRKWECTRGVGHSFGYAANESPANIISPRALIHSFVDAVSKNGNLLLNIGPRGDGSVAPEHEVPLRAMGAWLDVNGEAVYGTRPWRRAEGEAVDARGERFAVRFTARGTRLFAMVLGTPAAGRLMLAGAGPEAVAGLRLLGGAPLTWRAAGEDLEVDVPPLPDSPAHTIEVTR